MRDIISFVVIPSLTLVIVFSILWSVFELVPFASFIIAFIISVISPLIANYVIEMGDSGEEERFE